MYKSLSFIVSSHPIHYIFSASCKMHSHLQRPADPQAQQEYPHIYRPHANSRRVLSQSQPKLAQIAASRQWPLKCHCQL